METFSEAVFRCSLNNLLVKLFSTFMGKDPCSRVTFKKLHGNQSQQLFLNCFVGKTAKTVINKNKLFKEKF